MAKGPRKQTPKLRPIQLPLHKARCSLGCGKYENRILQKDQKHLTPWTCPGCIRMFSNLQEVMEGETP